MLIIEEKRKSFIHSFILMLARKAVQKKKRGQKQMENVKSYFN